MLLDDYVMMADIIIQDDKCWNVPLITTQFDPSCTVKILVIPSFKSFSDDKHIWRVENNGVYSVRSDYRLCVQDPSLVHAPS
jgi:hypothetical protein